MSDAENEARGIMMVEYEWTTEERMNYEDGTFDIENHDFADRLDQYPENQWIEIDGKVYVLTLIRKDWYRDGGGYEHEEAETTRDTSGQWTLPVKFKDIDGNETRDIPKRFHAELAKRQKVKV